MALGLRYEGGRGWQGLAATVWWGIRADILRCSADLHEKEAEARVKKSCAKTTDWTGAK